MDVDSSGHPAHPHLKRSLSLPLITLYGLGTIIGAGIYVLVGEVAAASGMLAPLAFLLAAITASFTAFSYAELSARYPLSAGEAVYVERAFHKPSAAAIIGWSVALVGVVSSATLANGFVGYFALFSPAPEILVLSLLILALGLLAAWGIAESAWVAAIATVFEIGGLFLVLWFSADNFADLPEKIESMIPLNGFSDAPMLIAGAFLAFYAFIGFEDMVNVAEEVKNPRRNLPIAIMLALIITSALYVAVSTAAVLSLPLEELAASKAPLVAIVAGKSAWAANVIAMISLFAVMNGALIQMIMSSRVIYGMASRDMAPKVFDEVNARTRTPLLATAMIVALVWLFAIALPLVTLAKITSAITLLVFAAINAALLAIKHRERAPPETVTYPIWVPVLGVVVSLGMLVTSGLQLVMD